MKPEIGSRVLEWYLDEDNCCKESQRELKYDGHETGYENSTVSGSQTD
jgi:hypothetical protein